VVAYSLGEAALRREIVVARRARRETGPNGRAKASAKAKRATELASAKASVPAARSTASSTSGAGRKKTTAPSESSGANSADDEEEAVNAEMWAPSFSWKGAGDMLLLNQALPKCLFRDLIAIQVGTSVCESSSARVAQVAHVRSSASWVAFQG